MKEVLYDNRNSSFQYSNNNKDCCKYSPLGGGVHSSVCSCCSFNSMANVHYNNPVRAKRNVRGHQAIEPHIHEAAYRPPVDVAHQQHRMTSPSSFNSEHYRRYHRTDDSLPHPSAIPNQPVYHQSSQYYHHLPYQRATNNKNVPSSGTRPARTRRFDISALSTTVDESQL